MSPADFTLQGTSRAGEGVADVAAVVELNGRMAVSMLPKQARPRERAPPKGWSSTHDNGDARCTVVDGEEGRRVGGIVGAALVPTAAGLSPAIAALGGNLIANRATSVWRGWGPGRHRPSMSRPGAGRGSQWEEQAEVEEGGAGTDWAKLHSRRRGERAGAWEQE